MAERLKAEEVQQRIQGNGALLVCAYDDAEKCRGFGIAEAISYPALKPRLDSMSKSQELIFFCA